jgi:predicted GTPase
MSRWRILVVAFLVAVPFLTLAGVGSYYLWKEGLGYTLWWPLAACMALGYLLGWTWQRKQQLLRPVDFTPPLHWTERDQQAWRLVQARAEQGAKLDLETLGGFQIYIDTARELALELARHYNPGVTDPVGALTIPEILAVVELASHDLAEMVDSYLPGGHLLTIKDWRRAKQISDWYQTANKVYWAISALFNPVNTGLRYAASQLGMSRPLKLLQQNLIAWFYTAYVHRLGTYLIDLNSGRLRVGARRYRELRGATTTVPPGDVPSAPPTGELGEVAAPAGPAEAGRRSAEQVRRIGLTVMGQVKAGKSSFINALLGEQRAITDVLPATESVTRYELQPEGIPTRLVLFDTAGYGHAGPGEDQVRATEEAARQSDLVILVVHARNPARQADLEMVRRLRSWFDTKPELRTPPILAVLTHIDLLSPALEWAPPYNWVEPQRPKEKQIQQAWTAVREQLGNYLVGIVPVCTAPGKVYGVAEWFFPTLAELLGEAQGVALLRCIRAEVNTGKVRKVFHQLVKAGQQIGKILWDRVSR